MGAAPRLPDHPSRGHDRSITRPPGGRPLPLRLRFDLAALMPHIRQRVVAAGGSMSTFSIRLARRSDAPRMAAMSRDLIETGLGWRWRPERILACLRDRATNGLVAVERQRMIGFAVMKYLDEQAHLLLLAVAPGRRRSGVGRALFAWLEASARVAGIGTIQFEVRAGNDEARAFYHDLGCEESGTMAGYYGGREAAVRMYRRLRLAVDVSATPGAPAVPLWRPPR